MVAAWESRTGKYWVTLREDAGGKSFTYSYPGGMGGYVGTREDAIAYVATRVAIAGIAMPDNAKTPMKRVI